MLAATSPPQTTPPTRKRINFGQPAKWHGLFRAPGSQHVVERTVVHEYFAIRVLLILAVFEGSVEKLLDMFKIRETLCDSLRIERGLKRSTRFADPGVLVDCEETRADKRCIVMSPVVSSHK